jgi:hypothetical protein
MGVAPYPRARAASRATPKASRKSFRSARCRCPTRIRRPARPKDEPRFPLEVAFCPACSLVQLRHIVPPEQMFSEYLYFSSYSASMLRHAEALAASLINERTLGSESLVVEVASNDGYLLQYFQKAGVPVLGIEPAANIAAVARDEKSIPTIVEFFGRDVASRLVVEGKRANVMLGLNVMAHVPDLNGS